MDTITIVAIAALIVVAVVLIATRQGGGGINLGTLQSVLVIIILFFLAIWLGNLVLG